MQYNFGNIEGLISHFEELARRARDKQAESKAADYGLNHGVEARTFEYAVMALRQSDLIQMVLIPNTEDEIQRASERLTKAEEVIDKVRHSLFDSSNSLAMQRALLNSVEVKS